MLEHTSKKGEGGGRQFSKNHTNIKLQTVLSVIRKKKDSEQGGAN